LRRRIIIFLALILAILAIVIPLALTVHFSRERAIAAERAHMQEYANWTLLRAEQVLTDAKDVLAQVGKGDCSVSHIERMRQLAIDSGAVEEVGHYDGDRLACTGWGKVPADVVIGRGTPSATLAGGYALHLHVKPRISHAREVMVLGYRDHNVLILPQRLVDVLSDSHMILGIATRQGTLIAITGRANDGLVGQLSRQAMTGMDETDIYASVQRGDLTAFAIADRSAIDAKLGSEMRLLLPIGLVASAILMLLILWVSRQRLSPEKELKLAIRKREFQVHYQPLIELATGYCVGAEALVRWRRPDGRWIAPDLFIPLAEQSGLILDITDHVIEQVVADLHAMLLAEQQVHVAINISARDLESGRFLDVLEREIAKAGIAPGQIWLEVTERSLINPDTARATIARARDAGHLMAIDDFGTGYSSLSLLETLPLDALKIDKCFIDAIGRDAAASVVTPHIIGMGRALKLNLIAEGVETREQDAYVRKAGVQFAQGWYYAKALPADEFMAFYRDYNRGKRSRFLSVAA